jgi:hypothetical protein
MGQAGKPSPDSIFCPEVRICDHANMFFTSKFHYGFFSNPTHKTETGTADTWGTTNRKPSGPIIMMGANQKQGAVVRSYLLHSFLQVHTVAAPFYQSPQTVQSCWAKTTVFLNQTGMFSLFVIQFYSCKGHILSTPGDALRPPAKLSSWPCRNIFHVQVLVTNFLPTPSIHKTQPGTASKQVGDY